MATLPTDTTTTPPNNQISFYTTIFLFAVISFLLYKFVLSPSPTEQAHGTPQLPSPGNVVTPRNNTASVSSSTNLASANNNKHSDGDELFSCGKNSHPPHLVPPEKWDKSTSLSKYLSSGIVPFRSTPANGYETRLQKKLEADDLIINNRKERARIFARLFTLAGDDGKKKPPPNRGANIVVTIYPEDANCVKLQKVLWLLGTYYNLFVLVDSSHLREVPLEEQRNVVRQFRQEMVNGDKMAETESSHQLNSKILPSHRIVFSSTTAGKVAFVRQLNGVELVVDADEKVTTELERFGHRVLVYPKSEVPGGSSLGKYLAP